MKDETKYAVPLRQILFLVGLFIAVGVNLIEPVYTWADSLVWQTSKQAAVSLAQQQQKKILLIAGRDT